MQSSEGQPGHPHILIREVSAIDPFKHFVTQKTSFETSVFNAVYVLASFHIGWQKVVVYVYWTVCPCIFRKTSFICQKFLFGRDSHRVII